MQNIKVIDIHSHIFFPEAFSSVTDKYQTDVPRLIKSSSHEVLIKIGNNTSGPFPLAFYSVKDRIKKMKSKGVDVEVLSVFPSTFFYNLEIEEAKIFSMSQNDAISNIIKEFPEHFLGLATVPLQDTHEAIKEMERAINQLHMVGVMIGSNVNGKNLDDPSLRPFFKRAEELNTFLLVHPINPIGSERMSSYYLSPLVGNPCETTLAISSLIFGGILDEFPKLKVCFAHGGGFFPYQIGRLDQGFFVSNESKKNIQKPPSAYLKKIFFDTVVYNGSALRFLISQAGIENVLLGTDSTMDMEDNNMVEKIKKLGISISATKQILGENILRILGGRF